MCHAMLPGMADAIVNANDFSALRARERTLYDDFSKATDRIRALEAELQGTKGELYSVDKAAKQLGERVAKLEAALDDIASRTGNLKAAATTEEVQIDISWTSGCSAFQHLIIHRESKWTNQNQASLKKSLSGSLRPGYPDGPETMMMMADIIRRLSHLEKLLTTRETRGNTK
jgi:chromosome segregation ATPase